MKAKLIFLHGGPGYADYLEQFFQKQFEPELQTIFYTQSHSPNVSIDVLIRQLSDVIGNQNAVLVGHSWGGVLATDYLKRTQDKNVKGIVFINSYFCSEHVTVEYQRELVALGLSAPTFEQIFFTSREKPFAGPLISFLESELHDATFRRLLKEFASDFDHRPFARTMEVPLLNIFGDGDIRIPSRIIRSYAELNPLIENLEIKAAGHFPFLIEEDRRQVVKAIEFFVLKLIRLVNFKP